MYLLFQSSWIHWSNWTCLGWPNKSQSIKWLHTQYLGLQGPTHPDGDEWGGVEGREQHGVAKHQDEADAECDLQEGNREVSFVTILWCSHGGGLCSVARQATVKCFPAAWGAWSVSVIRNNAKHVSLAVSSEAKPTSMGFQWSHKKHSAPYLLQPEKITSPLSVVGGRSGGDCIKSR